MNLNLFFQLTVYQKKNIKKGDPYQWQVQQSVNKIIEKLNLSNLDWILSYQSRVGLLKWIGPSTEDEIIKASKQKKIIVVVPIAFVSEHSETLVELDIECKKLAEENGCKKFIRIPALGTKEEFIQALTNLVHKSNLLDKKSDICYPQNKCPSNFKKCMCSDRP